MSNTATSLRLVLLFALTLSFPSSIAAQPPDASSAAATIAPFLDEQTLLVARIDVAKLDPAALSAALARLAPPGDQRLSADLAKLEARLKTVQAKLAEHGIRQLFAIVSLADFPKEPLLIVAPLKSGAQPAQVTEALRSTLGFEAALASPGAVALGASAVVERLKSTMPVPRPEFARGLDRGAAPLQIVIAPSDDARRVLREMLPRLPDEIGGGSGKMLADGLSWATLAVYYPPRPSLSLVIHSHDAESAAALRGLLMSAIQLLTQKPEIRRRWPQVDEVARLLTPRLSGDQLTLSISEQDGQLDSFLQLLVHPLQAARTSAGRAQSMNNLKQLGLAMHNYHDEHKHFPPQATRSADGRALLSWRVAILPYLDAEALYKQFHLDEPWDSEHNRRLIEKMPAVFASPHLGDERRANGRTSYLVPLSRQPPAIAPAAADAANPSLAEKAGPRPKDEMVFDRPQGVRFQDITDGTSNTILVVEANPEAAVVWTKPEDLVIDLKDVVKDLRGQPDDGFCSLFGDGSAHFLKTSLDSLTLRRLLQMNDGQHIGPIH